MILDFEKKYLETLRRKYEELNKLITTCEQNRDQSVLQLKNALSGYLYLYVKWVIGVRHDEPNNMVRELFRSGVISKKEAQGLMKFLGQYEGASDIVIVDIIYSVVKKLFPCEQIF